MKSTNQQFTPDQREHALDLYRLHHERRNGKASNVEDPKDLPYIDVRAWLAVEKYILDSFTGLDTQSDSRIHAWMSVAKHPIFADCYDETEGTLLDAVLAKLNDVHAHPCERWRPVTREEIQQGWMIRSRANRGFETSWGVAHHQDNRGDWRTEEETPLTDAYRGWTYETTAPLPEPKPDPLIQVVVDWAREPATSTDEEAAIDLLSRIAAFKEAQS